MTEQPPAPPQPVDALTMVAAITDPGPDTLGVPDSHDPHRGRDAGPRPGDGAQDVSQDPAPTPEQVSAAASPAADTMSVDEPPELSEEEFDARLAAAQRREQLQCPPAGPDYPPAGRP